MAWVGHIFNIRVESARLDICDIKRACLVNLTRSMAEKDINTIEVTCKNKNSRHITFS